MITGRQIAAARALAGIGQKELAEAANISVPTLKRMEASDGTVGGLKNNIAAVKAAIEKAGITFIADGAESAAGGPGVRLSAPTDAS
ncbi:helix-turn-helix transcriptional regulator [Rhizobium cremeum]|uniref:helix-turn-helix domain-containing protein n=1 Tax=Rhizobium cremeum TaxID=2813827 RepID=UPI001FD13BCB|nr:helix-turn-helix transcriptional regulator [Rhizobium cremeum]MCJ7995906.1 helix-turn-helix transcriptional regulator [Rhizobium cremeum]MCJ7999661.1 helix-turn-helix transcriptional regulator [Rhizobium cremeum]